MVPFKVKVNELPPAQTELGVIDVTVGDGLFTVNELLVPAASVSGPLVFVAVILTPVLPGVNVTPEIVTLLLPLFIVPVNVPPRVPVPVAFERVTPVLLVKLEILSFASRDTTVTLNDVPAV